MKNFDSVEDILSWLEQQPGWEKFRDYRQLLECWQKTVSRQTATHTRPLQISRQVLWVATTSAAMAQELSFQRYTLLKKLNQQLPFALKDIRFSAGGWEQTEVSDRTIGEPVLFRTSEYHKQPKSKKKLIDLRKSEKILDNTSKRSASASKAQTAAQKYLTAIRQNSSSLSVCPQCGCDTPPQEIERWNLCYLCIAQKWSKEYRLPSFPESQ